MTKQSLRRSGLAHACCDPSQICELRVTLRSTGQHLILFLLGLERRHRFPIPASRISNSVCNSLSI